MGRTSLRRLLPELPCVFAGEGRLGKEVRAVSKPKGRRTHVRKGKVTARKVSDILNSITRLVRAVGVLVDALASGSAEPPPLPGESSGSSRVAPHHYGRHRSALFTDRRDSSGMPA